MPQIAPVIRRVNGPRTRRVEHALGNLHFRFADSHLYNGDFASVSRSWPCPTVIIVDGPYGLASFPGDPVTHRSLPEWYTPHLERITEASIPLTTLWFWNSEVGWATMHPVLEQFGWEYRSCHIWDKGIAHAAGNSNTKTLRKFPVVTEVCAQYVRVARLRSNGCQLTIKEWVRKEWERSGLPFSLANEACGVKNAATRKYLSKDHLWYFPPPAEFVRLSQYANKFGAKSGKPYFTKDGKSQYTEQEWDRMRAKFYCKVGVSNVWSEPAVRGSERVKSDLKCLHMNQKPLRLIRLIIEASSDPGDVVWEPFGGLCSSAVACLDLNRRCHSAEIHKPYFDAAINRLLTHGKTR